MLSSKEALINSTNEMKCEAHGTQQPGPINRIGEEVSTAQRSNSPVQSINPHFPNLTDTAARWIGGGIFTAS
ncbi:MAG: hypothetical protein LZF63_12735, partial [Nitrosomonas sp.]|nr:hypothetical protein [Nitrosomonas sp.]